MPHPDTQWIVQPAAPAGYAKLYNFPPVITQLLYNRGLIEPADVEAFLHPDYESQIHDPFLFRDMQLAVDRTLDAVRRGERIFVFGDYDADGVCSSAVLKQTLESLGCHIELYIPFRDTEGYGLKPKAVEEIHARGCDLLITVDCGVSNREEIAWCTAHGMDVIVLDHHLPPPELPEAYALINPSIPNSGYPFAKLCGAGVAFKFVQAIMRGQDDYHMPIKLPVGYDKWLLDLVAIATVGDVMPLVGENRVLVSYGLKVLEKTRRPGLQALLRRVKQGSLDSQAISWRIVPRLNAAGRMDHASVATQLIEAVTAEEAEKYCDILENNNKLRQQTTEKILKIALASVGERSTAPDIIIAQGEGWSPGLVGLIAGRLKDYYGRPALVVGRDGDRYVGSGRSVVGFDITDALHQCADYLDHFGGHAAACGFTVIGEDNYRQFVDTISAVASVALQAADRRPVLKIDAELTLAEIGWPLLDHLARFEPFGEGNPRPIFAVRQAVIEDIATVGADAKHLRILLGHDEGRHVHKFIGFSFGEMRESLTKGDVVDIAFELGVNEWNGRRELQLSLVDLKKIDK